MSWGRVKMRMISLALLGFAVGVAAQDELTVMTYNIRAGNGDRGAGQVPRENLERIAALISSVEADIVLLQEVDSGVERTGGLDELTILAEATGMDGEFAPTIELQGGEFGVALLSRWAIEEPTVVRLPTPAIGDLPSGVPEYFSESRVAQVVTLVNGAERLRVINTHLGLTAEQRVEQLEEIAALVAESPHPVVFGGDLNCEPDAEELAPVRNALRDCYQGFINERGLLHNISIIDRFTFPSWQPVRCIDYLFVTEITFDVISTEVVRTNASDHLPVVTRLRFASVNE